MRTLKKYPSSKDRREYPMPTPEAARRPPPPPSASPAFAHAPSLLAHLGPPGRRIMRCVCGARARRDAASSSGSSASECRRRRGGGRGLRRSGGDALRRAQPAGESICSSARLWPSTTRCPTLTLLPPLLLQRRTITTAAVALAASAAAAAPLLRPLDDRGPAARRRFGRAGPRSSARRHARPSRPPSPSAAAPAAAAALRPRRRTTASRGSGPSHRRCYLWQLATGQVRAREHAAMAGTRSASVPAPGAVELSATLLRPSIGRANLPPRSLIRQPPALKGAAVQVHASTGAHRTRIAPASHPHRGASRRVVR